MSPMSRPPAQLDTPEECHFATKITKQDRTGGTKLVLVAPLKTLMECFGILKSPKNVRFEDEFP